MLRYLTVVGVVLTSSAIAVPRPAAVWPDLVERDSVISGIIQQSSTTIIVTQSGISQPTASVPSTTSVLSLASGSSAPATATGPCASVSVLYAAFTNLSPESTATPTVPAQLAYECLNTIPFNQSDAVALLNSMEPYLNWQTTFEYLKDPPAEYAEKVQPPYDFWATWNAIKANASAGAYQSEYEFGWTLYRAGQLAHDSHLSIWPAVIYDLFNFGRDLPLVSVSLDGVSEPQPYLYSDIVASLSGNTSFTPSPIEEINGQDAVQYLLVWSQYGTLTDPDALWNNLFWEPAQIALGDLGTGTGFFTGGGLGQFIYPGPSTTLKFANGSTLTQENYAQVLYPFTNTTSGEDIYQALFSVGEDAHQDIFQLISQEAAYYTQAAYTTSNASATASGTATFTTAGASTTAGATSTIIASTSSGAPSSSPTPGYPPAFISGAAGENAGYFIDTSGYEDVAVLVVRDFVAYVSDEINFQAVNTYFIETAAAMGKTKLIIDLSGNGGGTILQGYDLFKQLFPSILPYGSNRYRAHEAFNLLGEQGSYLSGLVPRGLNDNETFLNVESTVFDYQTFLNVDYEPFTSWAELYGPHALGPQPDNFTSILRWNLSDVLIPIESSEVASSGIDVSGYLNRTNITVQPFEAENIIILTDGFCTSTCTTFTELMISQGGVKTVALGGRPQPGIMQAIGGTKGANNADFNLILGYITDIYNASNSSLQEYWKTTVLNQYNLYAPERLASLDMNVRNAYLPNETIPLQFVYQPADCRILYTPAMVVDQTAVWKTVADSVWGGGNGNACIAGGFGVDNTTSTTGSSAKTRDVKKRGLHAAREGIDYEAIMDSLSFRGGYGYIGTNEGLFG